MTTRTRLRWLFCVAVIDRAEWIKDQAGYRKVENGSHAPR